MTVTTVILFGTGSPLLGDVEESLFRAGIAIAAGIRNRPGPDHLAKSTTSWRPGEIPRDHLELPYLIPIFTPAYRREAAGEAAGLGFRRPFSLIDPSVPAPRQLEIGTGTYVNSGCTLGAGSVFCRFVLINRGASIGHHVRLNDFVSVGPGAVIAGEVKVGTGGVIGAGATVLPGVSIGDNAVIGAGSVVTRDVAGGCVVMGNPARIVRRDAGGYRGLSVG